MGRFLHSHFTGFSVHGCKNRYVDKWKLKAKSSNKIRRAKFYLSCTKNSVFLQLAAEKKTPLVQLKQIFGPSYFVRALVGLGLLQVHKNNQKINFSKLFLCVEVIDEGILEAKTECYAKDKVRRFSDHFTTISSEALNRSKS